MPPTEDHADPQEEGWWVEFRDGDGFTVYGPWSREPRVTLHKGMAIIKRDGHSNTEPTLYLRTIYHPFISVFYVGRTEDDS